MKYFNTKLLTLFLHTYKELIVIYFQGEVETWIYFYGPISILLFLNIVFFTMTSIHLRKSQLNCTPQKVKLLQYRFWLYLKLFFVMGLTWIFEVLSFLLKDISESLDYIWYDYIWYKLIIKYR